MTGLPYLDAAALRELLPWAAAIEALAGALRAAGAQSAAGTQSAAGRAPAADPPRMSVPLAAGELLLMPAGSVDAAGVKVVSVAPGNPAAGRPRIQGLYILFDAETLTPSLLLDGTALTAVRTPAVSALAAQLLAPADASTLVVFGTGPQARGHVEALRSIRPVDAVVVVGRDASRTRHVVADLVALGHPATAGTPEAVADADLVVCATTSRTPVFDGRMLAADACVMAVGSHEPGARELDEVVFARADRVVVEDRATALREAGDVIAAIAAGSCAVDDLVPLAQLATMPAPQGISVFKSVGMGWQDLAVATAAADRRRPGGGAS